MPENTAWSAKIKRSGFLLAYKSVGISMFRMLKIAALNFCTPDFPSTDTICFYQELWKYCLQYDKFPVY
jgi:hypothetical protein